MLSYLINKIREIELYKTMILSKYILIINQLVENTINILV